MNRSWGDPTGSHRPSERLEPSVGTYLTRLKWRSSCTNSLSAAFDSAAFSVCFELVPAGVDVDSRRAASALAAPAGGPVAVVVLAEAWEAAPGMGGVVRSGEVPASARRVSCRDAGSAFGMTSYLAWLNGPGDGKGRWS